MNSERSFLIVEDRGGKIIVTREYLLKHTRRANTIAAVLMTRLSWCAFTLLFLKFPVMRRSIHWITGNTDQGILDCTERLSHAVREGRCLQKISIDLPEAPHTIHGN